MDELLAEIADFLLDTFLELIASAVVDLVFRALLVLFTRLNDVVKGNRVLTGLTFALLGVLAGALSLLALPLRLIQQERPFGFHGISLLVSPIIVGLVLSSVGAVMRRWGKKVTPVATFAYGFAFAFGMALIRFLFAK